MTTFAIYHAQFDTENGRCNPYDTTVVGEVNLDAAQYKALTPEQACLNRLEAELKTTKNGPWENIFERLVNFTFWIVECDKQKDADTLVHSRLAAHGFEALKNLKTGQNMEFFNLGDNSKAIVQNSIEEAFNKDFKLEFKPRIPQIRCLNYMTDAFVNGYNKFLVGAICRFGKSATLLHYFTTLFPKKRILVITGKCDTRNSWNEDYLKFVDKHEYKFVMKNTIENEIKTDSMLIAWLSFQSAAKNYTKGDIDDETVNVTDINEEWQQKVAEAQWDVVIIDEVHFAADTPRSKGFLTELRAHNKNVLLVEVSATPFKKLAKNEYDRGNAFIYDLDDEKVDWETGNLDCNIKTEFKNSKYVYEKI